MLKNYNISEKLKMIQKVIDSGPYKDDWESLSAYEVPKWYEKLKFGIFIHYGVFSVPAFDTEWYPRMMYVKDSKAYKHHIETYGEHTEFGYKDFIPMFRAENFDPNRWCDIFKRSHAQYVVPVAEHHDGFQMYESELSSYNAKDMGPGKDIIGLLKKSVEDSGMIFGTSSHRIEHYFFLGEEGILKVISKVSSKEETFIGRPKKDQMILTQSTGSARRPRSSCRTGL